LCKNSRQRRPDGARRGPSSPSEPGVESLSYAQLWHSTCNLLAEEEVRWPQKGTKRHKKSEKGGQAVPGRPSLPSPLFFCAFFCLFVAILWTAARSCDDLSSWSISRSLSCGTGASV